MKSNGFTLIELLIVVAIIGILAAIAVPNFLSAQTRAKVSRTYSDMRSVGTAIESYHVDNARYPKQPPPQTCIIDTDGLAILTTPIAYIASMPMDLFHPSTEDDPGPHPIKYGMCTSGATYWYLWSFGPDKKNQYAGLLYQSSNGLISKGDLKRTTAGDVLTTDPQ